MTSGINAGVMKERVLGGHTPVDRSRSLGHTPKRSLTENPLQASLADNPPIKAMPQRDGFSRIRLGRPRNTERDSRKTSLYYDLRFPKGGRKYRVTLTSMSVPEVAFEQDFTAFGLRGLLSQVAYFIGATRKPRAARHFTATFQAYPDSPKIMDAIVGVPFAEPQEADDRPLTVLPSFDEDLAI